MRLLALFVIGLCASPVWAQPDTAVKKFLPRTPPVESVEKIVRDFVEAANQGHFVEAQYKIYGARYGFFGANEWSRKAKSRNSSDIVIQSISEPQIQGDQATVTVKYHLKSRKNGGDNAVTAKQKGEVGAQEQSETVSLKMALLPHEPNRKVWQIVPPETEPTPVKGGPILSSVIYKMAQQPLPKSDRGAESLERLKGLALATLMFVQDFDQQFAFSPEYVREALAPYLQNDQPLFIPGTLETYTFNANLSERYHFGVTEENPDVEVVAVDPAPPTPFIKKARQVVMFYEGHDQKPVFRYDGKAAICFADGHTALVSPDEARTLIWNPA